MVPMRASVRSLSLLLLVSLASAAVSPASGQAVGEPRHEIVRGRVTSDSGVAIGGADVIITMAPGAETFSTATGADGTYTVSIPGGTGEYLFYAGALGHKSFKRRLTRASATADTIFAVDVKLPIVVTVVGAVKVKATRPRPVRAAGREDGKGTTGLDRSFDGPAASLAPELEGNLDAMAMLMPGIMTTPNGPSVFGLGAESNKATLNGLDFAGTDLPRDAKTATRFQLSPWDPSSGGFAGALAAVTMDPGGNLAYRHGHVTLDRPAMQFSDRVGARTGQTFGNFLVSAGGTGPLVLDKYFYNYGAQVTRRTASTSSLLSQDADVLQHEGLSADSVQRLLGILGAQRVPLGAGRVGDASTTTTLTFIQRIDHAPSATISGTAPTSTWSLTGYGRYALTDAATIVPTATPGFAGRSTNVTGALQGIYSMWFGQNARYLNETTSGVSVSQRSGSPYMDLPGGNVLVASTLPNGSSSLNAVAFGGNSLLSSDVRTWSWETINQTTFIPARFGTMPLHLYLQSRFTGFDQSLAANRLGRFDFASLADLAAGRPSAFTRTLDAPDRAGAEWIGAAAVGGTWTVGGGRVVYTGGARLDANAFMTAPRYNADVDRVFGARTDHMPNDVGVSPRLGFTWFYNGRKGPDFSSISNGTSTWYRGTSSIRGGVGEFRDVLPATLVSDAIGNTGLADATRQLRCVGAASPIPDWQSYSIDQTSVPTTCANGAPAFADSARGVTLFDRAYTAPRTWKGTLGWTHWNDYLYVSIDGTYALNLHQPGTVDLNFAGTPAFQLANEGNRQVFVAPGAVVGATGTASTIGARRVDGFGRVLERVSDLRGDARQLSVYIMPGGRIPLNYGIVSLGYTYVDARAQARGFDQSATGDPREIGWASSVVPRHAFTATGYHEFLRPELVLTASVRAMSGLPYTPIIAGDVNGDGLSGDRAFVFDPATTADPQLAASMRDLLANGSGSVRRCLQRQLGELAGRNSCLSSWSATLNAGLAYFGTLPHVDRRAKVTLSMLNVLGGLDGLLHGANGLRGWGTPPIADPVLYRARGFDQDTHRFLYDVNGRFGTASPATTTLRAPFRLSLDVSMDIGRSPGSQGIEQSLRIRPGLLGTRAPADTIKKRYIVSYTDVYGMLISLGDSIALSGDQIRQFQSRRAVLSGIADSLYTDLAQYLAAIPVKYDRGAAQAHINTTRDAVWEAIYAEIPFLKTLMTPGQVNRLPSAMKAMLTVPNYHGRFFAPRGS